MSGLRKIAVCYLVSVSAFGLAAGLRAWPDVADQASRLFDRQIWRPAAEALARADRALLDAPESKPRFAMDASDTMSSKGKFSRRPDGSLRLTEGYRVLIDIENYSGAGGEDAVALF